MNTPEITDDFVPNLIDDKNRYLAIAIVGYTAKLLHTGRETNLSSYGMQRWVDEDGYDYGPIYSPDFVVTFISIVHISDQIADFLDEHRNFPED